jgi:1-phosphatidylinositol phosphodiesterase
MTTGWTHTRWMTALPDDIPISELSIPGTHNSAAINMIGPTLWACQCHSITEQLNRGIRLLDIRLKPKPRTRSTDQTDALTLHPNDVEFKTCHGRLGLFGANEFQSFDEVMEECIQFLKENPGETIIMIIKIDDWRRTRPARHPQILRQLQEALNHLPLLTVPHLPTLGECRGRLYLINRINDDPALGVPLDIPDNTPGALLLNDAIYCNTSFKNNKVCFHALCAITGL